MILKPFLSFLSLNIGEPLSPRLGGHQFTHSVFYDISGSATSACMHLGSSAISPKVWILHKQTSKSKKRVGNVGKADGWVGCHSLRLGSLCLVCVILGSMLFLMKSPLGVRAWWRGGNAQMV